MNSNMTLFKGGKKSVTTTAFDKLPEKQHEKKKCTNTNDFNRIKEWAIS